MKNTIMKSLLLSVCLTFVNTATAACFHKYDGGKPNTVMIEEKTENGVVFRTYVNGKLLGQTPYPNITDEMNNYRKGTKALSAGKYAEYEVCISPREV